MFGVPVVVTRPASREALDEMVEKLESVVQDIRRKAFDSFLCRGEGLGSELEDWLKAERDLFAVPDSEMKETREAFEIKVAVPGFRAEQLHVQVLPELIIIEGCVDTNTSEASAPVAERVVFSEMTSKRTFRQYKLGVPVRVEEVAASLNHGMLTITAPKVQPMEAPKAGKIPLHTEVVRVGPLALELTASK